MLNKGELITLLQDLKQIVEMTSKIGENQESVGIFRDKWMEGITKWGGAFQTFDKLFNMDVREITEKGSLAADLVVDAWDFGNEFINMQPDMVSLNNAFADFNRRVNLFLSAEKPFKERTEKQKRAFVKEFKKHSPISMVELHEIVEQSDKLLLHCLGLDMHFESIDKRIKTIVPVLN